MGSYKIIFTGDETSDISTAPNKRLLNIIECLSGIIELMAPFACSPSFSKCYGWQQELIKEINYFLEEFDYKLVRK